MYLSCYFFSGVIIGYGINLGAKKESYFQSLDLTERLFKKIQPYINKKGPSALKSLKKKELILTEAQAKILSDKAIAKTVATFEKKYNEAKGMQIMVRIKVNIQYVHSYGNISIFMMSNYHPQRGIFS